MIRFTPLLALLVLAACQSPMGIGGATVAPPADPKSRLIAAVEAEGCVITAQNANRIQTAAGLTAAEIEGLAPQLIAEGIMELSGPDSVRFRTENCR